MRTVGPDGGVRVEPAELAAGRAQLAEDLATALRYIEHLKTALVTNRRIAVAVGILMARTGLTEDEAFETLRRASQRTNRKVRDLADEVAYTGDLPTASAG